MPFPKYKKLTKEEFVEKAIQKHGGTYDYSLINYQSIRQKVWIVCRKHGQFYQMPYDHLEGKGCPICGKERVEQSKKFEQQDFIDRAIAVHGIRYNYEYVEYNNSKDHVEIECRKHGVFWQKPSEHLRGQGCPYCNPRSKLKRRPIRDTW